MFLPRTRRLFVAGGESAHVAAVENGRRIGAAGGLPDADNLRLFASTGPLFAGYGSGLVAIDPDSIAVVQRIAFCGRSAQPILWVSLPDGVAAGGDPLLFAGEAAVTVWNSAGRPRET